MNYFAKVHIEHLCSKARVLKNGMVNNGFTPYIPQEMVIQVMTFSFICKGSILPYFPHAMFSKICICYLKVLGALDFEHCLIV